MKKHFSIALLLSLVISLTLLIGCGQKKADEGAGAGSIASDNLSEELAHHAYDAVFILSFATLNAPDEEHGITKENDGVRTIYTFKNTPYMPDEAPEAVVNGLMKIYSGETEDRTEVSLGFENDPLGLKRVDITSAGPHLATHTEGTFKINEVEKPFKEFTDYFAAKSNGGQVPADVTGEDVTGEDVTGEDETQ